ncbi:retrovirus-related pol polyprotein from transposon TNT 1-94 [Tanacetum coccineum]
MVKTGLVEAIDSLVLLDEHFATFRGTDIQKESQKRPNQARDGKDKVNPKPKKPKRVKDSTYHKEKMLLCKQAEKGVQLQAEQSDWLADTDEEIDEQELEAHYSYMAKIQEVPNADSGTDAEPLEQVQYDTDDNVFANDIQHFDQSESISNTCAVETGDSNVTPDSPNMCDNDIQDDQNDLDVDENKKIQKQLKKANATLTQELTECKSILAETSRTLGESNIDYDKLERMLNETLRLLAQKENDIKESLKVKAYEISVVKEKHDELVKQSLLTKSHYEGLVKEKTKVITDLKLKEEKDIGKIISMENQLKFLNEIVYKRSRSIQTIHMLSLKCPTFNGRPTFANPRTSNVNVVCATCGKCVFNANHDACVSKFLKDVNARTKKPNGVPLVLENPKIVQLILFIVDSGCTKHMTGNLSLLCNFVEKYLGTVRFGNDQFAPILADLEVAFWKSTCFVRDLQGNDLLTGNRGTDLYSISIQETTSLTPICLMDKASPTQACSFKSKTVPSSKGRVKFAHMDLMCPMRVASIKDGNTRSFKRLPHDDPRKSPSLVIFVRTDRGTEFLNKTLNAFFKEEGIEHQTSTPRTPEQNGIVERRNRTLVEAARTMLSASKLPLFFWAKAIATACYTQNRSIIIPTHEKMAYHIINDRKPSIKHLYIFGCTCYLTRDGENLDKMKEKGDPCILVGYSTQSKGYHVYNKRTRLIVESIHLRSDEDQKSDVRDVLVLMTLHASFPNDKKRQIMTP